MSLTEFIDPTFDKAHAAWLVAQRFGETSATFNSWSFTVEKDFEKLITTDRRITNKWIDKVSPATACQVKEIEFIGKTWRSFPEVTHFSGIPPCFLTGSDRVEHPIDNWQYYEVCNGFLVIMPNAPVVFDTDKQLISGIGSAYRDLTYFYDIDLREKFASAPTVSGSSILIADDISMTQSFNYAHWLTDWMPRLSFAGNAQHLRELNIVTTPLRAPVQSRAFELMGVSRNKIVEMAEMTCVRFEKLYVPGDLTFGKIRHPAQTASSTAIGFLRSNIGYNALARTQLEETATEGKKIYISREDAAGRKILNEDEFSSSLESLGYKKVVLTGRPLENQIRLFGMASHIVGIHGAGLGNAVFCEGGAKLLEIFPEDFGLVSIRALAQSVGCQYATYLAKSIRRESRELDDLVIDVPDFMARCGDWL